jgi:hypothetical protein
MPLLYNKVNIVPISKSVRIQSIYDDPGVIEFTLELVLHINSLPVVVPLYSLGPFALNSTKNAP